MTAEEAQAVLLERHYAPAFIQKCAEYGGVQFSDVAQVLTALRTVAQVKLAKQSMAQPQDSLIDKAAAFMDAAMFGNQPHGSQVDDATRSAFAALAGAQ